MGAFIDWLGDTFQGISDAVINVLPKSPFTYLDMIPEVAQVIGTVNYFIPVNAMLVITETWLVAIGIWYVSMVILRWAKAIQ